jgi:hypothetical protein
LPASPSAGEASYLGSAVVVVTMHGEFTARAPEPQGDAPPRGSVLSLVIDEYTGHVDVLGVENEIPSAVANLGTARALS